MTAKKTAQSRKMRELSSFFNKEKFSFILFR